MIANDPIILLPIPPIDAETTQRAGKLFPLLQRTGLIGTTLQSRKQAIWDCIYAGILEAQQLGGELEIPTGNRHGKNLAIRRAILAAAVDAGVLKQLPRVGNNVRQRFVPGK